MSTSASGSSTGAAGLLGGAVVQPWVVASAEPTGFVWFWVSLALIAGAVFGVDLAVHTVREGPDAARRTMLALRQLVPALAVGALLTGWLVDTAVADHLPGIWALCFGLGVVASRPFLPAGVGAIAWFYLVAGALMLLPGLRDPAVATFGMGVTFGLGQLGAACVLRRAEEVRRGGC